jgi:predicted DNA-binding protein (MmcQ/YjbR family)
MSRERINAICSAFPGAEWSDPWGGGHDAWKVGGKMFACIGAATPGVSVKTDSIETAAMLIEVGAAVRAPYFHSSWVNLPFDAPEDVLSHRISESYRLIHLSLPRKLREALG